MQRLIILSILSTLFSACAQNPATGGQMFTLVSKQQEMAIGEQTANHFLKLYGVYKPSSRATQYVTGLCEKTFAVTESAAEPLQCILLDSATYNAWATPGYINVYRGLLPYINTEAELVAVVAHESGHITARHIASGQTRSTLLQTALMAGLIYAGNNDFSPEATSAIQEYGSQAAAVVDSTYGRGAELEADSLAQRYMTRLGYDKREEVNMVRNMQIQEAYQKQLAMAFNGGKAPQESLLGKLTASHPPTPERYTQAVAQAGGEPDGSVKLPPEVKPATTASDPQGRKRYLTAINGLEFGPQRKFGIGGRGYITFPAQRFVLNLPDGFVLDYVENQEHDDIGTWLGAHPQSGTAFSVDFLKAPAGTNPGNFLQTVMGNVTVHDMQRIPIGAERGDPASRTAYTGTFSNRLSGKAYRLVAIPMPPQTDRDKDRMMVVSFNFPTTAVREAEQNAILNEIAKSRYLTVETARPWQPLEIKTFTATGADSVAARAAALPTGAMRQEWFRALNGLAPDQNLKTGVMYKTVADPNLSLR